MKIVSTINEVREQVKKKGIRSGLFRPWDICMKVMRALSMQHVKITAK